MYAHDVSDSHSRSIFEETRGSPTGGDAGCSPYFGHGAGKDHFHQSTAPPPCPTECANKAFPRPMLKDTFYPQGAHLRVNLFQDYGNGHGPAASAAHQLVREAIMTGGPVAALMHVDDPFFAYKSGVYTHACEHHANHVVVAIGWGPDSWLCLSLAVKLHKVLSVC